MSRRKRRRVSRTPRRRWNRLDGIGMEMRSEPWSRGGD
jgi:hypothetical protein